MKIENIYTDVATSFVSAQVLGKAEDETSYDLTATLQFVTASGAVTYDFSAYTWSKDGAFNQEDYDRIKTEIEAVNRMAQAVQEFQQAFVKAADDALAFVGTPSA